MFRRVAAILTASVAMVNAAVACDLPGKAEVTLGWARPLPLGHGTAASGFGWQRHPILGFARPHFGVDWIAEHGTPILAVAKGKIVEIGRAGEFGNVVRIDHGGGWETTYAHLHRFDGASAIDACVAAGQTIGTLGNTGLSAGPHLHFEILRGGKPIDPLPSDKR